MAPWTSSGTWACRKCGVCLLLYSALPSDTIHQHAPHYRAAAFSVFAPAATAARVFGSSPLHAALTLIQVFVSAAKPPGRTHARAMCVRTHDVHMHAHM